MADVGIKSMKHDNEPNRLFFGIEAIRMKIDFFFILQHPKLKKIVFLKFNNTLRIGLSKCFGLSCFIDSLLLYFGT